MKRNRIVGLCGLLSLAWTAALPAADSSSAPEMFQNSLGMKFVRIQPGSFRMGSETGDFDERPVHTVVSDDLGKTWTYSASPLPGLGGGQRLAILRLQEGPILFCSFGKNVTITDATGTQRPVSGLFTALPHDDGRNWTIQRLISDDGPPRTVDGGGNTGNFTMSADSAEPRGYLSICQTPDGVIHLIASKQHYGFNLAWLEDAGVREMILLTHAGAHFGVRCLVTALDGGL